MESSGRLHISVNSILSAEGEGLGLVWAGAGSYLCLRIPGPEHRVWQGQVGEARGVSGFWGDELDLVGPK